MKVVIYARVSTDKQTHDSQLDELRRYCSTRNWDIDAVVTDTISGSKFDRAGLDEVMRMVRKGKIDAVVVYKLDRLGRSLPHLAQIIHEMTGNGVALVVPSQGIDTSNSNPAAKLQLHVLCAVAEFEREIIRERVNAGLASAKARGVRLGRRPKLHRDMEAVRVLRNGGRSIREIADELSLAPSSVFKIIQDNKILTKSNNMVA